MSTSNFPIVDFCTTLTVKNSFKGLITFKQYKEWSGGILWVQFKCRVFPFVVFYCIFAGIFLFSTRLIITGNSAGKSKISWRSRPVSTANLMEKIFLFTIWCSLTVLSLIAFFLFFHYNMIHGIELHGATSDN